MEQEFIEVEARSVDEAVLLGLTRLGAMREEVSIEVLQEGSRGFLGIGARLAKVRLTKLAQPEPPPAVEKRDEPPMEAVEATPATIAPPSDVAPQPVPPTTPTPPVPEPAPQPVAAKPKPRPRSRPEPKPKRKPTRPKSKKLSPLREQVTRATLEIARHLFADLDVQMKTSWRHEDRPTLWLSLKGKDANLLVGPRAQVLDSVQYLMRTLVHHRVDGNYNVVVDADGYRRRRLRSLEALAKKKVEQAVRSGRTVRLRPMPPNERRLVHMLLQNDKRIRTRSVGSGRNRSVTIIPNESANSRAK